MNLGGSRGGLDPVPRLGEGDQVSRTGAHPGVLPGPTLTCTAGRRRRSWDSMSADGSTASTANPLPSSAPLSFPVPAPTSTTRPPSGTPRPATPPPDRGSRAGAADTGHRRSRTPCPAAGPHRHRRGSPVLPRFGVRFPTTAGPRHPFRAPQRRCEPGSWSRAPYDASAFDQQFHDALDEASRSYDRTPVDTVVDGWWAVVWGRGQNVSEVELAALRRADDGDLSGLSVHNQDGTFSRLG